MLQSYFHRFKFNSINICITFLPYIELAYCYCFVHMEVWNYSFKRIMSHITVKFAVLNALWLTFLFFDHCTESFTSSGRQQIQKVGMLPNLFLSKRKGTMEKKNKDFLNRLECEQSSSLRVNGTCSLNTYTSYISGTWWAWIFEFWRLWKVGLYFSVF